MMPGVWEWALILGVLVLLFGGKKLPQLGGAIGESIRNFKKGIKEPENDEQKKLDTPQKDKSES